MGTVWLTKNLAQAIKYLNNNFQLKATSYELLKKWKGKGAFRTFQNYRKQGKKQPPKVLYLIPKAWSNLRKGKRLNVSTSKCLNLLKHKASHCRTMSTRNRLRTAVKSVTRSKSIYVKSITLSSANNSANFLVTRAIHRLGQSRP